MNYAKLLGSIRDAFLNQDGYFFDKHVPEFSKNGKFYGDYFNQLAVEPMGEKPPRFYHTYSPFDVISNKAPHYAAVFENGERILDVEFDSYVTMRTAAMNAVVLTALGIKSLSDKKVLIFGSGKIATEAVKILASEMGLENIDVVSKSGNLTGIIAGTKSCNITINSGNINDIGKYDVIIAHTQTSEPLLGPEKLSQLKDGAVLTSFITSTNHGEFPDEAYDSANANIIMDWPQSALSAKDLKRALDAGRIKESDLIYIKNLLSGVRGIDPSKKYTLYRSSGTPIQNLAILKLLLLE